MFLQFFFFQKICSKAFTKDENIPVTGIKVNPRYNPLETYRFNSIPLCFFSNSSENKKITAKFPIHTTNTSFLIKYLNALTDQKICKNEITDLVYEKIQKYINNEYVYEMQVTDLPVWAKIGEKIENISYVYSQLDFIVKYRDYKIVEVSMHALQPVELKINSSIEFSYSVFWLGSNTPYMERFQRYFDYKYFGSDIRYNGLVLSIFQCFFMCTLMFYVVTKYMKPKGPNNSESGGLFGDVLDKGWFAVHGDVFRHPDAYVAASIIISIGKQVYFSLISYFLSRFVLRIYYNYNMHYYLVLLVYLGCSYFCGTEMRILHQKWQNSNWITHSVYACLIVPAIFIVYNVLLWFVNFYFHINESNEYVVGLVTTLLMLLSIPIAIISGTQYEAEKSSDDQITISAIKRRIPNTPFYVSIPFLGIVIGIIGWLSISIEIPHVITAIWKHKIYPFWSYIIVLSLISSITVASSTIIAVYFRLAKENYHWQWMSIISPSFTGIFVLIQCLFHMPKIEKENMNQLRTQFVIVSSAMSMVVAIAYSFVGFTASDFFVKQIYRSHKTD